MRAPNGARMHFDAIVVPRGVEQRVVRGALRSARTPLIGVPAGGAAARGLDGIRAGSAVLVLGLCGALAPALRVGDPIVYREIVDGDAILPLDVTLARELAGRLGVTPVRAANAARVVTTERAKRDLARRTDAAAVDMEAAALARALQARGMRVAMVRVVSDAARGDLPPLEGVYDAAGALRPLALALALLRSPARGARFILGAAAALRALARTAARLSKD